MLAAGLATVSMAEIHPEANRDSENRLETESLAFAANSDLFKRREKVWNGSF